MGYIRFIYTICFLLLLPKLPAQEIPDSQKIDYDTVSFHLAVCPSHKLLIDNDTLTVAFLKAMSYYPELCHQSVRLKYGRIKTSMAAQPRIWSVFRKRSKRKYQVIVNKKRKSTQAQLLYAAPFDAQVGVLGHELAHILDYSNQSGWQVTCTGIRYLGKKFRRKMEWETDSVTISRGLGWQLYRYAYFVIHEADISEAYRNYKLDFYMKPEEILEYLKD